MMVRSVEPKVYEVYFKLPNGDEDKIYVYVFDVDDKHLVQVSTAWGFRSYVSSGSVVDDVKDAVKNTFKGAKEVVRVRLVKGLE